MIHALILFLGMAALPLGAAPLISVTLATNGPGNLPHLPVDLIKRIGADAAEGVDLSVHYFGGGPLAYRDMLDRNADFAVAGAPALAELRVKGEPVVSVATVNRVPPYVLMVRSALRGKVKEVADLKGHVVGTTSSSARSKSTSQQVVEFSLRRAGVRMDQVHFMPAGQSLEDQTGALESGAVDAIIGFEPFASQQQRAGKVFLLMDLHDLEQCRRHLGGLFLHSQLATREDMIRSRPETVERMVRVMRRTLQWIDSHSAEEITGLLRFDSPKDRAAMLGALKRHKAIFSPDGAFTEEEIRTAERFFREIHPGDGRGGAFDGLIDSRWAGRRGD